MTMSSIYPLILVAFVSLIPPRVALAQEPASTTLSQPINVKNDSSGVLNEAGINERLFIKSFISRRKNHLNAVKNMRKINSYEKQYKMVTVLIQNVLEIVNKSHAVIGDTKFVPGDSAPLQNITVKSALTTILENCALFGDVVLQLPDITSRVIRSQKHWKSAIEWVLNFVNETKHLMDEPTVAMFDLVRQELKITPRDPNYTNPFWSENNKKALTDKDKRNEKKNSKNQKRKKGPQLSLLLMCPTGTEEDLPGCEN